MSQNNIELIIPPYPSSATAQAFAIGDVERIKRDLKALQNASNPALALSWNAHDRDTQDIVSQYNNYLRGMPGHISLDWHLIKAMQLIETGPYASGNQWEKEPMQSANPRDSGWSTLISNQDKMNLIVPPTLRGSVATPNSRASDNIAAGVGYLLYRAAIWGKKTIIDKKDVKIATVERGDSLYNIARRAGTTEQVLREMNSRTPMFPLKPGTKLSYSPARTVNVISGWKSIDPQSTYTLYNAHSGSDYGNKMQFMYNLIKSNKILN